MQAKTLGLNFVLENEISSQTIRLLFKKSTVTKTIILEIVHVSTRVADPHLFQPDPDPDPAF
jgi:hypothetical protein